MEFSNILGLIGWAASIFSVLLNLAMILQVRDMWNNQTHEGINPIMTLFLMLNDIFWTMYGFLRDDLIMIIPNFLGTIIVPIILFLIIYFSYKKQLEIENDKNYFEEELK
ncbi:MAG: SWEET family sugar transporter [Methanobrevibacter sp.]|nr:SWEET family sugar transporter [Candidatus Methanovirga basalitermitum]